MSKPSIRFFTLGAAAALSLALAGCVVAPAPYGSYGYYGEPVSVAPPPPQVEYMPAAPAPGWLWIGGFWSWRANRHVWVGGHWEAPRPGYRWVPHQWQRQGQGWRERPGYWNRR
ncbi:hypothetical protein [Piscinibacter sp.]|uniref:hypothetical protein n=1 Tax=Piscinibacter sp. TaxID=1903157 RepID=UPI0039E6C2CD